MQFAVPSDLVNICLHFKRIKLQDFRVLYRWYRAQEIEIECYWKVIKYAAAPANCLIRIWVMPVS